MSSPASDARQVFLDALEVADPAERERLIAARCAGHPGLQTRVEELLRAAAQAGGILDQPLEQFLSTDIAPPISESVGTVIGPYKLMEQIGEGGFGLVFVAEQQEPVRRRVALKIIRPGMNTSEVVARFEAERQALALMDHPNIAKVLDAGSTQSGLPYFVMELVRGVPITKYCDNNQLTPYERLDLFIAVCRAVQHAHQKGIIHRDIKPSNVLVTRHDGVPVVKVIDFGVAKALHQPLTDRTIYTRFAQMIGTPLYASPEQAEMTGLDIDTRSDIYSLGVLLYELLTGTTPVSRERMATLAYEELVRIIREEEPPKPSTRLTQSSDSLASVAAQRKMEPLKLTRLIRGDLDWITMKALEKDRNRRYDTATAFAADIERYLTGEPVLAVPPSVGYRLRRFVRRHRIPVAVGTIMLGALLLGVVGLWTGLTRAQHERERAQLAEHTARSERQEADSQRRRAELTAADLQVELDLMEVEEDTAVGLLRLARTLHTIPPEAKTLREFVTTAILATGQVYAPLAPPLTHDGHDIVHHEFSPDGRLIITLGEDRQARLWETATSQRIAILQQGEERLVYCAFTLDGKTVVTDSEDGALRFWEATTGQFRAASVPRTTPFSNEMLSILSESLRRAMYSAYYETPIVGSDRVITKQWEPGTPAGLRPLVELWDVETGRRMAELQEPGDVDDLKFAAGGQRILGETNNFVVKEGKEVPATPHVIVWSADDGRELLRTPYPGCDEDWFNFQVFAPSPRRLIAWTVCGDRPDWHGWYSWETGGWRLLQKLRYSGNGPDDSDVRELPDGRLALNLTGTWYLFRDDETEPQTSIEASSPGQFAGSRYWTVDGELFDVSTGKRLRPPEGRRLHPELAELMPNGRFLALYQDYKSFRIFDFAADKQVMTWWFDTDSWFAGTEEPWHTLSDRQLGFANGRNVNDPEDRLWLLQIPLSIPEIPPQQLELWAQVALCGELGADDNFQYWDEPTWERHRQKLARWPAVTADVPFPGFVAQDRRHWLRQQHDALVDELGYRSFGDATKEQENSIRVIEQLLERAQADGDDAEIGYWQTQLKSRQRD